MSGAARRRRPCTLQEASSLDASSTGVLRIATTLGTPRASRVGMNEFDRSSKSTAKENVSSIKDSVSTLVDQGSATVDAIKARLGDVGDQVKESSSAAIDRTTTFIEANPFKSVAISFGIGYVLMRLRTSPLVKIALVGGLGYLGTRLVRR
jgi:ElaB/YqjD/DUF883 family membrane-anchored ribosome-binding protein